MERKKVGIITFHSANNPGAVLQCLAIYEQIKKLGAEPYIINYRPKYLTAAYLPWVPAIYKTSLYIRQQKSGDIHGLHLLKMGVKRFVGILWYNKDFFKRMHKKKAYDRFRDKYLIQYGFYANEIQLRKKPPKADVFVCGSDQIWNKVITGGKYDTAYFLQFGKKDVKRAAYAPSIGETDILMNPEEFLSSIKGLDEIFIRESLDCQKLKRITGKSYENVMDPTLMMEMQEYRAFEEPINMSKPYVFVYTKGKSKRVREIASKIAQLKDALIVDISSQRCIKGGGVIYDCKCGPGQFLSYVKDACFVVTNSFHATAFSLIYHKKFITVAHATRNARMEELLGFFELKNRLLYANDSLDSNNLGEIDYTKIEQKFDILKINNINILKKCIIDD